MAVDTIVSVDGGKQGGAESMAREVGGLWNDLAEVSSDLDSVSGNIAAILDDFTPTWDAGAIDFDKSFMAAAKAVSEIVNKRCQHAYAAVKAANLVAEAARNGDDARIIVLDRKMPWEAGVFDHGLDEALYVVYPDAGSTGWMVAAVPPSPGSFEQRLSLPEEWAGLRGAELAKVSGVEDAIFCHPARFVGGAESKEGAVEFASKAIELGLAADPRP